MMTHGKLHRGPLPLRRVLVGIWCFPTTLPGLLIATLTPLSGGRTARHTGVVETHGGLAAWLLEHATPLRNGADAMTLGEVVLGRNVSALRRTRAHERVHVGQARRWGPLFYLAYALATLAAWGRGEHPYQNNRFEVEARGVS